MVALALAIGTLSLPVYVAPLATKAPVIDGKLDDVIWRDAPWTNDFLDIVGSSVPKPRFRTRAKMAFDRDNLYIAAELEEPDVWATLIEHDSVIFHDNDFEVFLDPDGDSHRYVELELNAKNTTWDLLLLQPYRSGGPPVDGFELKGLRTAVHVDGTLNDPNHRDRGWTVEIAIPFSSLRQIAGTACPPKPGDQWRINFSRVEWQTEVVNGRYVKVPAKPEDNWVWTPMRVVDMHRPDRWGVIQFGGDQAHSYAGEHERELLARTWEAEMQFRQKNGHFTASLTELGLTGEALKISVTPSFFEAICGEYHIDQSLRVWRARPE